MSPIARDYHRREAQVDIHRAIASAIAGVRSDSDSFGERAVLTLTEEECRRCSPPERWKAIGENRLRLYPIFGELPHKLRKELFCPVADHRLGTD